MPETPQMSHFLAPANPLFDLKRVTPVAKKRNNIMPLTLRETLLDQPPLGPNERLPLFLALKKGEIALSTTERPVYTYVPEINLYVPARHELLVQLVRKELTDTAFTTAHGSPETVSLGCNGPLCRRTRREERLETARIRQRRLGYRQQRPAVTARSRAVPQYVSVDPLLTAFTVLSHQANPPTTQLTYTQKTYRLLTTQEALLTFLKATYRGQVE